MQVVSKNSDEKDRRYAYITQNKYKEAKTTRK
jgi:hypothetical protein